MEFDYVAWSIKETFMTLPSVSPTIDHFRVADGGEKVKGDRRQNQGGANTMMTSIKKKTHFPLWVMKRHRVTFTVVHATSERVHPGAISCIHRELERPWHTTGGKQRLRTRWIRVDIVRASTMILVKREKHDCLRLSPRSDQLFSKLLDRPTLSLYIPWINETETLSVTRDAARKLNQFCMVVVRYTVSCNGRK